jgi:siroheme synthase
VYTIILIKNEYIDVCILISEYYLKGFPKSTPVAIIERATTPEQRTLSGTLETIGHIARRDNAKAPGILFKSSHFRFSSY